MQIRQEQMDTFSQAELTKFEACFKSFTFIQTFLEKKKFNWTRAELKALKVKAVGSSISPSRRKKP
jgi:hypothetical protein